MKKSRKWIILFFIILSFEANAQIVNEIISYVDSTELIVNNGRKFLLNRIEAHDNEKAKQIFQYLEAYTGNQKYAAFDLFGRDLSAAVTGRLAGINFADEEL